MKKIKLKKKYKVIIAISIFLIVFIFSIYNIVTYYLELNKSNKITESVINEVIEVVENEEKIKVDFEELLSINSDTVGWIRFNNNQVNNPITQYTDNDYYLTHAIDKSYNSNGTIFMDYRNNSFDDQNVVIFGHSLKNNTMFGSLKEILDSNFFDNENNNYIYIYTPNGEYVYQIFSYYLIDKEEYYITTAFNSNDEFKTFIKTIKKRSKKDFKVEVNDDDYILTLSTCYGSSGTNKRLVIHAKRIKV